MGRGLSGGGSEGGGWWVMGKTGGDGAGGVGWYWSGRFGSGPSPKGNGVGLCSGCHDTPPYQGITSKDYVLTPFPLQ